MILNNRATFHLIKVELNPLFVSKTAIQLLLFGLFLAFFGIPSFTKYNREETMIVKSELDTEGMETPAVTIQATKNAFGWKSTQEGFSIWGDFELFEHCQRINMTLEECIEEDTIKLADFLLDAKIEKLFDSSTPLLLNLSYEDHGEEDMTVTVFGKYFTFNTPKSITLNQDYCMTFTLVRNFTYVVFVHDKDFFLHNSNPLGPPINYRSFSGNTEKNHYQELSLTRQKKLNLDQRPCDEDEDYSFTNCIGKYVSNQVAFIYVIIQCVFCDVSSAQNVLTTSNRSRNKFNNFS